MRSVIAITVKTADEISNSRPGAHKEKVEESKVSKVSKEESEATKLEEEKTDKTKKI